MYGRIRSAHMMPELSVKNGLSGKSPGGCRGPYFRIFRPAAMPLAQAQCRL